MKKKLVVECPLQSGIVIITKTNLPSAIFFHAGITVIENGIAYIFHNTPHKKNKKNGSIIRELLSDYLKENDVIEIYDSCTSAKQIHKKAQELWEHKWNWLNFNCEHFIYEVTGARLKRGIFHTGEKIIITLVTISAIFLILRAIFVNKK